jgi:hypothetical protein
VLSYGLPYKLNIVLAIVAAVAAGLAMERLAPRARPVEVVGASVAADERA